MEEVVQEVQGKEIGEVTHFFSRIGVAVIKLTKDKLNVGDTIRIKGHTTDFEQKVDSMQIDHKNINEAKKGAEIGMRVQEAVRENDTVYRL
ncbi:hypothetical protein JW930_04135 [Candidatus Woesearchaeota archaeon]|nr:hypothetical protein [Candidatus Woesearchaeota archaeon]